MTSESSYDVGYTAKGTGKVYVMDKNENWAGHETLTAVGMLCRMFIEKDKADKALEGGAKLLSKGLPEYDTAKKVEIPIDYYYWYYATQAMYQFDGPAGKYWTGWNDAMKKALLAGQKDKNAGCLSGSWDASVDRWGFEGGRVYATALNALTLETYYRYPRVLEKEDGKKK